MANQQLNWESLFIGNNFNWIKSVILYPYLLFTITFEFEKSSNKMVRYKDHKFSRFSVDKNSFPSLQIPASSHNSKGPENS